MRTPVFHLAALWGGIFMTIAAGAEPVALPPTVTWARGVEGQRKADLGDGQFLNPILAGDHPWR